MKWPWQSDAEPMRKKAEALDRAELRAREDALADLHRGKTLERIKGRWAAAEQAIVAKRTVAKLTLATQLVPVPARRIAPLKWGNRKAGS